VFPAMMTSLALPDRRVFKVDLYPNTTISLLSLVLGRSYLVFECRVLSCSTFTTLHDKCQSGVDAVCRLLCFLLCRCYRVEKLAMLSFLEKS